VPHQETFVLRVRPSAVDLDRIAKLDGLVRAVLDRLLDPEEALARLAEIEADPLVRPWPIRLGAYGAAGAAIAPVLGGGWQEVLASAAVGLVVGAIALIAQQTSRAEPMIAPLAAAAASFCGAGLTHFGLKVSADAVTLAALVSLLPGMTLTIGIRELATQHLASGVANTANALVQLLGLVFGVGVGRSISTSWFGRIHSAVPNTHFSWIHVIAAIGAGLAFTLTLRAPWNAAPVMCSATVLSVLSNAAGRAIFGASAGVFFAALVIGLTGGVVAVYLRRSPLVFIVPGVFMLVPGSAGFNSLLQLLTGQTVTGIEAGFQTFVTALSIAYGLMVSTVILPRRFSQFDPRSRAATSAP
jgi:uncharacterized membrane protein YjjP (DUF1212 family)